MVYRAFWWCIIHVLCYQGLWNIVMLLIYLAYKPVQSFGILKIDAESLFGRHLIHVSANSPFFNHLIFTPLAFQADGVFSLPASDRLSVRPSVRQLFLVRAITHHIFGLESPNLHQKCILWYSRLVLKMEVIDLDLQVHFGHFNTEL